MKNANSFRILICACLIVGISMSGSVPVIAESIQKAKAEDKMIGRFQIYMPNGDHASGLGSILLDTVTGDTWRLIVFTDLEGQPFVWRPLKTANTTEDIQKLIDEYGLKSEESQYGPSTKFQKENMQKVIDQNLSK